MRQGEIRFTLRHQGCCQTQLRLLKVGVVLESSFKKLLCLVELIHLAMDLGQLVEGVGVARIQLQLLLKLPRSLRSVFGYVSKLPARQERPADAVMNFD